MQPRLRTTVPVSRVTKCQDKLEHLLATPQKSANPVRLGPTQDFEVLTSPSDTDASGPRTAV